MTDLCLGVPVECYPEGTGNKKCTNGWFKDAKAHLHLATQKISYYRRSIYCRQPASNSWRLPPVTNHALYLWLWHSKCRPVFFLTPHKCAMCSPEGNSQVWNVIGEPSLNLRVNYLIDEAMNTELPTPSEKPTSTSTQITVQVRKRTTTSCSTLQIHHRVLLNCGTHKSFYLIGVLDFLNSSTKSPKSGTW